jgi:hypothetical protein
LATGILLNFGSTFGLVGVLELECMFSHA